MSVALSGADVGHLAVAAGLTYALGFERAIRGALAGDRVFALIGTGSGVVGIIAAHGAPNALAGAITGIGFIGGGMVFRQAVGRGQVVVGLNTAAAIFAAAAIGAAAGQGRLLVAGAATVLTGFVLEIRHMRVLRLLDGRRWASRFGDDEAPPPGVSPAVAPAAAAAAVPRLPDAPGAAGASGSPGTPGAAGSSGTAGTPGSSGTPGDSGEPNDTGVSGGAHDPADP